jgi:hypothetical protein
VLRKFIINFHEKGQVYIEEHRAGADALMGKILLHMVKLKNKRLKK